MLGQRRRRWANVKPTVVQRLVFAGRGHRSALARLRTGVAPINIEIVRYTNTPVNNRECPFCPGTVEDE